MKRSMVALAAGLAGLAAPGSAWAHWVTVTRGEDRLFTVWYPEDWTVTVKRETITTASPDGLLWSGVWRLEEASSAEQARERISERVRTIIKDPVYKDPRTVQLNGMKAVLLEGSGRYRDKPVDFLFIGFEYAPGSFGVAAFVGGPEVEDLFRTTVVDIATSIRPEIGDGGEPPPAEEAKPESPAPAAGGDGAGKPKQEPAKPAESGSPR